MQGGGVYGIVRRGGEGEGGVIGGSERECASALHRHSATASIPLGAAITSELSYLTFEHKLIRRSKEDEELLNVTVLSSSPPTPLSHHCNH